MFKAILLISISIIIFFAGLNIVKIGSFVNISFKVKNASSSSEVHSNFLFFLIRFDNGAATSKYQRINFL